MIRHVAVFRFKDNVTDAIVDEIDKTLATLPSIIPEIVSFSSGRNANITEGAWDYAVVSDFASPEDYLVYATDPQHVEMVKNLVGPHVLEASRTQFEI
ncbi:MAG: Dabb family protein [Actinomycetia bacterium]|nr:Dabb family protein [Actinomycetes bacterium]